MKKIYPISGRRIPQRAAAKFPILLCCLMAITGGLKAQGIYQFWGLTDYGGTNDEGVLFSARFDGTGINAHDAFKMEAPGFNPKSEGLVHFNGKLYGMMPASGKLNKGLIYAYDLATKTFTKMVDFVDFNVSTPRGSMALFEYKLYGIMHNGGQYGGGVLFEYDPVANSFTIKHHFQQATGWGPDGGITIANNKLYGATNSGPGGEGTIYSFDPFTSKHTMLRTVPDDIASGFGSPMAVYQNFLYGVSNDGHADFRGTIYEYNISTNAIIKTAVMSSIGANGSYGGLVKSYNNKFYGGCDQGGANGTGLLFEYDPVSNQLTKKMDLSPATGNQFSGMLVEHDQQLYGLTTRGGQDNDGTLFAYDPTTNNWQVKVHLNRATYGGWPMGTMLAIVDQLYGLTCWGGSSGQGTLFEYSPNINGFKKLIDLYSSNGHRPSGRLTYYSGKLYGVTKYGGNYGNGVIFSYDLATRTYAVRYHMQQATGIVSDQGGMLLYNNRLYGVAVYDNGSEGVLYEFNPLNDTYTVKHFFDEATGVMPRAVPVYYNGKLYGTASQGGANDAGVLYEFDLATNTYAAKVSFGGSFGKFPAVALTLHNNKLYGATNKGGANDEGTMFVYTPAGNGFQKLLDFGAGNGNNPASAMVVSGNTLYGATTYGGTPGWGVLYGYDITNSVYKKLHEFTPGAGYAPLSDITLLNNKLYGLTSKGGDVYDGGKLFEYDLTANTYQERSAFNVLNGFNPNNTGLTAVPAQVAPGQPGSCTPGGAALVNTTNASQWIPFTDEGGNAVIEINPNGNMLGNITVQFYTHNAATRKDAAGRFYLDRNITITVDQQPATPVSVRYYVRKAEFEQLKNTAGSGILNVSDLTVFHTPTPCNNTVTGNALPVVSAVTTWGLDYVYTAQVSSFSTFYFASKAYTALPVKLEYFKGIAAVAANELSWKAACTEPIHFTIGRSVNGSQFTAIGEVAATSLHCGDPFQYADRNPPAGRSWYRLQMQEASGATTYSSIVQVDRTISGALQIALMPNPVSGNTVQCLLMAPADKTLSIYLYDALGRPAMETQWRVQRGAQTKHLNLSAVKPGIYQLVWVDGKQQGSIRFVRQ